jgi:HAD superfamily hydrolase (TIGR01509 family)
LSDEPAADMVLAMENWPKAVMFDFDGVIVNSEPLHLRAFQQTLSHENIHISDDEYYQEMIGFDDRGAFRYAFEKYNRPLDPQTFDRVLNGKTIFMMRQIEQGKYQALDGVREFVTALAPNHLLAICSGALGHEIKAMLDGVGLRKYFPIIVSAEDVTVGKPDPSGYIRTMNLLARGNGITLTPQDCLIVEDAPSVIRSVRSVGFSVLAVANTYPLDQLTDANWAVSSLHPYMVQHEIPNLKL